MNGEPFSIADAAAFVAAIDAELERTTRENVERVRKGRQSQAESDYVVGLLRDVRSDLTHAFGPLHVCFERADPVVRWRDKVRWISRELEARNRDYPELVRKGRMTEADARTGIRVIKTLYRLYWRELFMWEPEPGPALEWLTDIRRRVTPDAPPPPPLYRELVRKHAEQVALEDGDQARLVA